MCVFDKKYFCIHVCVCAIDLYKRRQQKKVKVYQLRLNAHFLCIVDTVTEKEPSKIKFLINKIIRTQKKKLIVNVLRRRKSWSPVKNISTHTQHFSQLIYTTTTLHFSFTKFTHHGSGFIYVLYTSCIPSAGRDDDAAVFYDVHHNIQHQVQHTNTHRTSKTFISHSVSHLFLAGLLLQR